MHALWAGARAHRLLTRALLRAVAAARLRRERARALVELAFRQPELRENKVELRLGDGKAQRGLVGGDGRGGGRLCGRRRASVRAPRPRRACAAPLLRAGQRARASVRSGPACGCRAQGGA